MSRNADGGWWTKGKIIFFSILAVVIIAGGSIGGPILAAYINAGTSGVISKQQEHSQVNTADNRIQQYDKFYNEYGTYQTDLAAVHNNILTLKAFNKEYTSAQIAADQTGDLQQEQGQDQQNVSGASTICVAAAQAYNQDSRKVLTGAQFKGVDLSQQVNVHTCFTGSTR